MTEFRKPSNALHWVAWLVSSAVLTLSLLLIIYSGSHSRLMGDDFCHLTPGLEYGPWQNVLFWRNSFNGSYSKYFLYGLVAPLDTLVPSVFVVLIVGIWLFGLVWLIVAGHRLLGQMRPPLSVTILIAAAMVSYSIFCMVSQKSVYWFASASGHTLPIALLTTALAACCAFVPRLQSQRRLAFACALFALVSFAFAGLTEAYAVLQLGILILLLPVVFWLIPSAARRESLALNLCGMAATVASLLVMLTAPGVSRRLAMVDAVTGTSPREPVVLFSNLIFHTHTIFRDIELITGFAGMLALSLFLVLAFQRPAIISPVRKPFQVARAPLLLCLLVQLLLLPMVWTHQSDNSLLFHRFSAGYMTVVGAHAILLAGLAAILLGRRRINACLLNKPEYWAAIPITTLTAIVVIFGLSQFRAINTRAATFISCNVFVLLLALFWQFHIHLQSTGSKRRFLAAVTYVFLAKWLCAIGLLTLNLAIFGKIFEYSLPFVSFAFVFSGFMSGICLAYVICHVNASFSANRAVQLLARGSAIVAIVIGFGVLSINAKNIPELERFSRAWDERHQLILSKRESGEQLETPPRLPTEVLNIHGGFRGYDYWSSSCASDEVTELIKSRYQA